METKTDIQSSLSLFGNSLLYRLISIYPHEFSRVAVLWLFRFLYRFALVLGWTFLVSYFVERFGEGTLSYLFLIHAAFVIAGSLLLIRLSRRFSLEILFLATVLIAAGLLVFGQLALRDESWKLVLVFFVEAFILVQWSINFDTFVERLFTPLESERTFPVIESADTLAALCAGFFLFLSSNFSLFTLLWALIGALFALVPLLLFYQNFIRVSPGLCMYRRQLTHISSHDSNVFHHSYQATKKHDFTRALIWIVLIQWAVALFLEFLFTVSVSQEALQNLPPTASGVENILIHEFGFLYILFGTAAFLSQIFLAPRIISSLGIVNSMTIYPILYLLSMIGIVGAFGFFTTVFTKLNAEITGGIYRNAYQSSYYVFEEEESQHVRLFLEGIIRPLGVLFATLFLLFGRFLIPEKFFITAVIFLMFLSVLAFLFFISGLQKKYLHTTTSQLFSPHASEDLKLHLLEILHQKGNEDASAVFYKLLADPKTSQVLQLKILELLRDDSHILPVLFEWISKDHHEIRLYCLQILKELAQKGSFSSEHYFSRHTLLQLLKKRYVAEHHDELRLLILEILALVGGKESTEFFLDQFQHSSGQDLSNLLFSAQYFSDHGIFSFLHSYLSSEDPRVWSSACIALLADKHSRPEILKLVMRGLRDDRPLHAQSALRVARILKEKSLYEIIRSRHFSDAETQFFAILTLAQSGEKKALLEYFSFLTGKDLNAVEKSYSYLTEFSPKIRQFLEKQIQHVVSEQLHHFLRERHAHSFDQLSVSDLRQLRAYYLLLGASEEVLHIDHVWHQKDHSYHPSLPLPLYF